MDQHTSITRTMRGSFLVGAAVTLVAGAALVKGATLFWGQDAGTFFRGIIRNPKQVGAFTPCSVFVSQEITKWVARDVQARNKQDAQQECAGRQDQHIGVSGAHAGECTGTLVCQNGDGGVQNDAVLGQHRTAVLRVLEVGGGSGIFTGSLVKQLEQLHDHAYQLDVIEIDANYCAALTKRFAPYANVHIHCIDATLWEPAYQYDYIVSSLPFTNMPVPVVQAILTKYEQIIKPGGIVSYVQLMLANQRGKLLRGTEKETFNKKVALLEQFNDAFEFQRANVWLNITPAYVHHLQIAA